MSFVTLRTIRTRVRVKLRILDHKRPGFDTIEIDEAIANACIDLASMMPPISLYTTSGLTIAAGGNVFALPTSVSQYTGNDGGAEYRGGARIQLVSTGQFLEPVSHNQMDAYQSGHVTIPLGRPSLFALYTSQNEATVRGRCWPGALAAEPCNTWLDFAADDIRDFIGSGTDDMDDVRVQFPRLAANALVFYVCAELLRAMDKPTMDVGNASEWEAKAMRMLYKAGEAQSNLEDTGFIERWEA